MQDELNVTLLQENDLNVNINGEDNLGISIQNDIINVGTDNYEELNNLPQINSVELIGNKTLDDLGIENDKHFTYVQDTSSDTWVIEHNLNKYPAVSVIDSANEEVVGEVTYNNTNQITIKFKGAFKGTAILN